MNKTQLINQAKLILENCLIYDTETTGLGEEDTIVEMAIIEGRTGLVVLDTLIRPLSPMTDEALEVHGIEYETATKHGEAIANIIDMLFLRAVHRQSPRMYLAAFNRGFDNRMLRQSAFETRNRDSYFRVTELCYDWKLSGMQPCIMELANRWFIEHAEWDSERSRFKRLSLNDCLSIAGIQRVGTAHSALSDALAAYELVKHIAETKP